MFLSFFETSSFITYYYYLLKAVSCWFLAPPCDLPFGFQSVFLVEWGQQNQAPTSVEAQERSKPSFRFGTKPFAFSLPAIFGTVMNLEINDSAH